MRAAVFCVGLLVVLGVLLSPVGALYSPSDDVIMADESNFQWLVLGSPKHSIVEFFAPWCGHCKNLAPEYKKLATNLKGMINVVAVDADAPSGRALAQQFGIKGFPTLKFFNGDTHAPEDYTGARSAAAMANFVLGKLQTKHIQKVTQKTFDSFLKNKLPKVVLFTAKTETTNLYKALSYEFRGRMLLGEVHKDQKEVVDKFNIDKFPSLVVIRDDDAEKVVPYEGALHYKDLATFLNSFALPAKKPDTSKKSTGSKQQKTPSPPPKAEEPPKLVELQTQKDFEENCVEKGGLCAIAFIPPAEVDEEERKKDLDVLEQLVAKQTRVTFRYMWVDGKKESKFREAFGLSQDLPVLAVLNPGKKRYAPFLGAFTADAISDFTEKILLGSKKTVPLDELPSLSE